MSALQNTVVSAVQLFSSLTNGTHMSTNFEQGSMDTNGFLFPANEKRKLSG